MQRINKVLARARKQTSLVAKSDAEKAMSAAYDRMSVEQLQELAYNNPLDDRIREIFASVGAEALLEGD